MAPIINNYRFIYRASTGEMVRYIVILKGDSAYCIGLDACEICGGCNPIPIDYTIADGKLKVSQAELEKNAKIFQ